MFVTNWISTTKIQKISEITNFFRHYFLSRTEVTLQGYWGKWTVMLYADNGWNFMEGENIGHNPPSLAASASYHIGDFDFTLYMHNPFMAHPKSYSAEIVNALLRKQVRGYDNSGGNLLRIGVAWNINRGKEYRKIQRNINNEERETGILK